MPLIQGRVCVHASSKTPTLPLRMGHARLLQRRIPGRIVMLAYQERASRLVNAASIYGLTLDDMVKWIYPRTFPWGFFWKAHEADLWSLLQDGADACGDKDPVRFALAFLDESIQSDLGFDRFHSLDELKQIMVFVALNDAALTVHDMPEEEGE